MKNSIKIGKVSKMASAISNSNPSVIGESTVNGKRGGLIYQMFYNQHSVEIEIEGSRNTEAKREAVKQSVVNHFTNKLEQIKELAQQPIVRRSLPLSNADLWVMSNEIVAAMKAAIEMPPDKVDTVWFSQLEGDWFDWLEDKMMSNNT